jgi:putative hydrolase of the HAD superfamily
VTNNPKPQHILAAEIRRQGLPDVFDTIVSSWELGWRKPHHIPFQTALDNLGVTADETAHVGDSLQNDIEPALALGMTAVFRSPTPTQSPPPKAAYHTITSLLELPPLLGLPTL